MNVTRKKEDLTCTPFTFINTNARSICPKINSLIDTMEELDAAAAVITESWLADGESLEEDKQDLLLGAGLSLLTKNRRRDPRGVAYGGVALFYREEVCNFKQIEVAGAGDFEVLIAAGSMRGHASKVVVIAAYIPPNYTARRAHDCIDYINGSVVEIKRRYKDPIIVLSGDFNQWPVQNAVEDFTDFVEVTAGPTRGTRTIDRTMTNLTCVTKTGLLNPLQTDGQGPLKESDHLIFYMTASIRKKERYKWLNYSYRYKSPEACQEFGNWLQSKDWSDVLSAVGSDCKTRIYQAEVVKAIEAIFPLRTVKRKNTDPPWINDAVRRLIRARKRIFIETRGRSPAWKKMKRKVEKLIKKRRKVYHDSQRIALLAEDGQRNFFKNTKNYMSKQRPRPFEVMDLFPGKQEAEVAEILAAHFNEISNEFRPLNPVTDIPKTHSVPITVLIVSQVAKRLKNFKKPKSIVTGDIFPDLVTRYSEQLAVPLTSIYNEISRTFCWPSLWKEEFVTIIPKTRTPSEIGHLRNISCTMLASKVYESYVLEWALAQVKLKSNQFGGTKGCSTSHLIISIWQKILSDLEDHRAATVLTAIDYAKAFNRMQYQECLRSFARHGASREIIRLVATFLTDRKMTVRVGNCWSARRSVSGGVPQGSILGVLLFNLTTDNLDDAEEATGYAGPRVRSDEEEPLSSNSDWSDDNEPAAGVDQSTPVSTPPEFEPGITPLRRAGVDFVFLDNARNVRRAIGPDPDATVLRDTTVPLEPNPPTSAIWKHREPSMHKFVDDSIIDSKIDMENVQVVSGKKEKHAIASQNMFKRVVRNAESIGMKVNTAKTNQICVSDALAYEAEAFIMTSSSQKIECGKEMKVLGYYFSSKPNCSRHVQAVRKSFRGKYWLLIHLKQNQFKEHELLQIYKTIIRPIAEYCAPAFHSMLTDQQDEQLERLQSTALRYIYGYGPSYAELRELAGLPTLRARRIDLCDKFARKTAANPRFEHWFPRSRPKRATRHTEEYKEEYARCDRLKNSPVFYMRRRLNGKDGKKYGKRNCQYRDN